MTLHLKRFQRLLGRVKNGSLSVWKNRKIASLFPMVMITFSVFPIIPANSTNLNEMQNITFKFDTSSTSILTSAKSVSVITPGESTVQRIERERLEAEAKTRAEVEAKSLASRNTISRERRVYSDPSNFDSIYQRAESVLGVDWKLLKSIHLAETGGSGSSGIRNASGATGPMQFLPSTFRRHGVDGNGDGITDITNVEDAIFSAAGYLNACGYPNVKQALWGYNPSTRYFNKVMGIYNSI